MRLYLEGHDYRYAVEQMLFTLFPGERPEYPAGALAEHGDAVYSRLTESGGWIQAETEVLYRGIRYKGAERAPNPEQSGKLDTDRIMQRMIKLSFYEAGIQALGSHPPWGALTGVRPVKIPTRAMAQGASAREAQQVLQETYHVSPDRCRLAMDCAQASLSAAKSLHPDEVSLYIGIPFCPTRCLYCSFVSADVKRSLKLVEPFLEALHREIAGLGALLKRLGRSVRAVYIGGGTPTTLTAGQLDALMACLSEHVGLSRCTEYTVEAGRPDTITAEKLAVIRRNGANRISVNPQTMDDHVLELLGRGHTVADTLTAFELARSAGFSCINMDLIAGLSGDTAEGFRSSLDQVLALGPENITVHTLALKKGSRLLGDGIGPVPSLPDADTVCQMLEYALDTLRKAGQAPYYLYRQKYMSGSFENVGWRQPGFESLYNICMMEELHTILALGGGGVTKLVNPRTGYIRRISNPKYPQEYIRAMEQGLEREQIVAFYTDMQREIEYGLSDQGN